MTPACAATHIPHSIYTYMHEYFFQYLCSEQRWLTQEYDLIGNYYTSEAAPLLNCDCDGKNYYGMPSIGFGLHVDQYDTNHAYLMEPLMFMSQPKIDPYTRSPMCSLGLWNLSNLQ